MAEKTNMDEMIRTLAESPEDMRKKMIIERFKMIAAQPEEQRVESVRVFYLRFLSLILGRRRSSLEQEPTNERRVNLLFMAKKWKGVARIMEPNKCDDLQWFELDNIPNNTISYIKQAINCFRNGITYSEYGF